MVFGQNHASLRINYVERNEDPEVGIPSIQFWLRSIELCRYVLAQRVYDEAVGSIGGYPEGYGPFLFYQNVTFHPAIIKFMEKIKGLNHPANTPLTFKMVVDKVNKSSAWFCVTATDDTSNEILLKAITMMVWVDKSTRKSVPMPAKFRSYIDSTSDRIVSQNEMDAVKFFNDFQPPLETFSWSRRMTYYDADFNSHVNNSVYVIICLQALEQATLSPDFSSIIRRGQLKKYPVQNVRVKVQREVRQGSMLYVKLWRTTTLSFQFIIYVENMVNVAFCCIDFFQPTDVTVFSKL